METDEAKMLISFCSFFVLSFSVRNTLSTDHSIPYPITTVNSWRVRLQTPTRS